MALTEGGSAPDFTLPGVSPDGRRDFTLSAERGHPVVLAFYPADDSPVCTRQLCSYQAGIEVFHGLDATLWGVSRQDQASHERFAARRGLAFPLLSDVDGRVHEAYDADGRLMTKRAVYVVDAEGRIAWRHVSRTGLTYQGVDTIAGVLRSLAAKA